MATAAMVCVKRFCDQHAFIQKSVLDSSCTPTHECAIKLLECGDLAALHTYKASLFNDTLSMGTDEGVHLDFLELGGLERNFKDFLLHPSQRLL